MDNNVTPKRDVPMWSETRWNGCWNAEQGVGIYLHMGRFRKDLDIWWVQTVAYLPGGELAVDRTWGRCTDTDGVRAGNFDLTMTEDGWTSTFDGVCELTTTDELTRTVRGAGAPSVPVRWELTGTGATPVWDLDAEGTRSGSNDFAGDAHRQQGARTTGRLVVHGQEYPLDGIGWKDHSSGVRDFTNWGGHAFTLCVLDDMTLHAGAIHPAGDRPTMYFGMCYRNGDQGTPVASFDAPTLTDLAVPGPLRCGVTLADGDRLEFTAEQVHALPMTLTLDNDNINGLDWDGPRSGTCLIEGISRLTFDDGRVGYAHLERSNSLSALKRPV
jgi:hypothetical protein